MPVDCQLARKARLYEAQSSSGTYTFSVPLSSTVHVPPRIVQHGDVSASLCHLTAFASSLAAAGIDACGMASLPVSRQPSKNFARVLTDRLYAGNQSRAGPVSLSQGRLGTRETYRSVNSILRLEPQPPGCWPTGGYRPRCPSRFVPEVRSVISATSPAPSSGR